MAQKLMLIAIISLGLNLNLVFSSDGDDPTHPLIHHYVFSNSHNNENDNNDDVNNNIVNNSSISTPCSPRHDNPVHSILGQDCSQSCSSNDDCTKSNEKCLCDGDCGLSCLDPDKCKYLPSAPVNGMVIGSNSEEEGMRAVFICDVGYNLVDGPEWKPCVNGEWVPKDKMPRCISQSSLILRRKRKAIKTGGSSVLRSKYGSGGGGGGGRRTFRRKKPGVEGIGGEEEEEGGDMCEDLDPLIDVEIIESGKYDTNDSFSDGAILNVSCGAGHFVNLANQIAKCVRGEWKPKFPQCKALPCKVPWIENGWCYEGSKMLYFEESIRYGKSINIHCLPRYVLDGQSKLICQFGEWQIDGYPPECVPAPCTLPVIQYGSYLGTFVPKMNVTHDTEVDYTCGGDFRKIHEGTARCNMGEWLPELPYCVHPSIDLNYASSNLVVKANATRRPCSTPPPEGGAILYIAGRPIDPDDTNIRFLDGRDVLYKCMGHPGNKTLKRNRWIRTCVDGVWSGSPLPCDGEVDHEIIQGLLDTINSSCFYGDRENSLVLFLNHKKQVDNKTDEFPTGSVVTSRCSDIGKYEFRGAVHRKCVSGQWLGTTPKCEGLSQLHDYALDRNPTILFRYVNGSIGQSNTGELVVYPGTTVHMECLWIRKFGPPKWDVQRTSNVTKEYVQGWTDGIPDRYADLEYRITIPYADEDDTGAYCCKTPSRHTHCVKVVVEATTCPELTNRNSLIYSTRERHLGVAVNLTCDTGYSLIGGVRNITCLANGQWSAPLPKCERLKVKCPDPPELENGFVSGSGPPYKPGDLAHFECKYGYMMEGGQAVSVCQDNGKWSKVPGLECVEACTYPGTIVGGTISPVKFYYKVQETIIFDCLEGYVLRGAGLVHCLPGSKWSNSLPTCVHIV